MPEKLFDTGFRAGRDSIPSVIFCAESIDEIWFSYQCENIKSML